MELMWDDFLGDVVDIDMVVEVGWFVFDGGVLRGIR